MDRAEIVREFTFEAAHRLPNVPDGHPCGRLHGHSFRAEVSVIGPIDESMGWVVDFGEIDAAIAPVRARLDHHYLNEIEGLENPTSEMLARWLWRQLAPSVAGLTAVVIHETCDARCVYRGPSR